MTTKPLIAAILSAILVLSYSAQAQQTFKIAKIEFEGLSRITTDEVQTLTGLKLGDTFSEASADAAAQRLIDSGLFKNVGYHTNTVKDQMTITFRVEEAKVQTSRVVFDNFIWFTDTELIAAVQREIPSFTGTAPDNGDTVERIIKALQRFLHENQIEATVNYMASQDAPNSPTQEHIFSVIGVPMPICTIHYTGTKNVAESKLLESSKQLVGSDYSQKFVSLFATNNLIPIYRELGLLKVAFAPSAAKPEATATCKSGVELTLGVDEGLIYKWDHAEWSGVSAITSSELNTVIGMQPGQTANGLVLDKLPDAIHQVYGRKGYLLVRTKTHPEFDDTTQKVMYKIDVVEGPQFRMGKLILKGFAADTAKALNDQWQLKPGDIFNENYLREFTKKSMGDILRPLYFERRAQNKPAPNVKSSAPPNRQTLTVDVTFELTN
ncbi:MAG: hypothetical protein C5B55_09985 [Blastocatellia bacterium]|nr:MAG: hypothetical protein C5B55_09985 [Blastocatellia bacterium]